MKARELILAEVDALLQAERASNDTHPQVLGVLQVGGTCIAALGGDPPVFRSRGRDMVRFSTALGVQEAERAATRAFERMVTRELAKRRSPEELRQTIRFYMRGEP